MADGSPKRRRLAISLRAFLYLILVLGLWLGWRVNKAREQRLAVEAIRLAGGFAHYDWEYVNGVPTEGRRPPGPSWLRAAFGDEYFQEVVRVVFARKVPKGRVYGPIGPGDGVLDHLGRLDTLKELSMDSGRASDAVLGSIRGLSGLEKLSMWDAGAVTDAGIVHLSGLRNLKALYIGNSPITDEALGQLASLSRLEELSLPGTRITDAGIAHIRGLAGLKSLSLGVGQCGITDEGLAHLKELRSLETLLIEGCQISGHGLDQLKELPRLKRLYIFSKDPEILAAVGRLKQSRPRLVVR